MDIDSDETVLFDAFDMVNGEVLGTGAFGTVHKAKSNYDNQYYAIKI